MPKRGASFDFYWSYHTQRPLNGLVLYEDTFLALLLYVCQQILVLIDRQLVDFARQN